MYCRNTWNNSKEEMEWQFMVYYRSEYFRGRTIIYRQRAAHLFMFEKKYKVGKVPVGMHSTSALKSIDINASVRVKYNPNKPKQSYLPDNNGLHLG